MAIIMKFYLLSIIIVSTLFAKPSWINNPSIDGLIIGVGLSNDSSLVSRRIIATVSARANLAESIKVEMKSYFKMIATSNNDIHTKMTTSIIEQKANELLIGSFVKDTYQTDDGILYVLVVIKKSDIK